VSGRVVALIAALIVVADRLSKLWVMRTVPLDGDIVVVPGFFSIVYFRNPGAAFGMFSGLASPWREIFLIGVAIVAVLVLVNLLRVIAPEHRVQRFAAAAVIGGAIGNLYDRVVYGEVVDFLYFYWKTYYWPAFNVADSFITIGAILLVLATFVAGDDPVGDESPG
jgi:signal peptidase II